MNSSNIYDHVIQSTADTNPHAGTQKLSELSWKPKGIILSGGPYSVYEKDAPLVDPAIFSQAYPILGVCYGLQVIAWNFGKDVLAGEKKEYGHATVSLQRHHGESNHIDNLCQNLGEEIEVYMSHGDKLASCPDGFVTIANTKNAPFAGIAHKTKPWYGIQFHPEVSHTPKGIELLRNFAVDVCGARQHWTMGNFVDKEIARVRAFVGEKGQVIGAVSGGVDSTVAATLMNRAIGHRFKAVLVDNGLLRQDEAQNVRKTLTEHFGVDLKVVDASERFLADLKGVTDPEQKRKIIGRNFIEVFEEEALRIAEAASGSSEAGNVEFLMQGTIYPDVIESSSVKGQHSSTIKSHHNVGGLPSQMRLKVVEPLRELYKLEVRQLGLELGIPEELVWRHPFPGPGLAIRIIGEVTPSQLALARKANEIFMSELVAEGIYREVGQAFAAILPVRAVGVVGDKRSYGQIVSLRAVETSDFMTADWYYFSKEFLKRVSLRITNEMPEISRVEYDLTSKPPGTIELE